MERETGYYWVKPRHWPFYDKWVVAKYSPRGKDYPDWELGAGRYDDESFKEINENRIPTPDEKSVESLLAEQHRNTRHDAIDVVNHYVAEYNETHLVGDRMEKMINDITRDIHNLKQRKP